MQLRRRALHDAPSKSLRKRDSWIRKTSSSSSDPRVTFAQIIFGCARRNLAYVMIVVVAFAFVLACLVSSRRPPPAPDDEDAISMHRISADSTGENSRRVRADSVHSLGPDQLERLLVCMPTVARAGRAEYVSNAVKSWRLATRNLPGFSRLVVFNMNVGADVREAHSRSWQERVFKGGMRSVAVHGDWLMLKDRLSDDVPPPVRRTHGDSEERISWRSKEALDYAEVLERCLEMAKGDYISVIQDDVLFTKRISDVVDWLDVRMGGAPEESSGSRVQAAVPWCSASLFDISPEPLPIGKGSFPASKGVSGYEVLRSSNMVARVYDVRDGGKTVARLVSSIRKGFDMSPVDWLADMWCKKRRRRSYSIVPSVVRHRGRVSSFADNSREETIT